MTSPTFRVADVRPEPHAAVPTLLFRLGIDDGSDSQVRHLALRCQVRIEPERRRYSVAEEDRLTELFGETSRWGQTLKPLLWTETSLMVPRHTDHGDVEVPVACSYDFEVTAARYLHALEEGEIPLRLLFSGTVFSERGRGLEITQIPWDREATYRLPVRVWRELMDQYFPNAGWLRLKRETLDALLRFKGRSASPTWDQTIEKLLVRAGKEL